jgi:ParB-like nuclease domain
LKEPPLKARIDSISIPSPLTDQLKEKSRRRRDDLRRARQVSAKPTTRRNDLLPQLAITYVPLDELRSSKRKLRRLDAAHVREVASSIATLGFCAPLLIDRSNVVVDGESRLEAAKLLGLGRAPCVRIDHLSDQEQRLLRLAVNRLGEKGQ